METGDLPMIELTVDRGLATIRAFWRLLVGSALALPAYLIQPDWGLLRLDDRASFLALGLIVVVLWGGVVVSLVAAGRWLLLAAWPGRLGIVITPTDIALRLGPFGIRELSWSAMKIELDEGIDQSLWHELPSEALAPAMRHPACAEDVLGRIRRFAGGDVEGLVTRLRPYLDRAMTR